MRGRAGWLAAAVAAALVLVLACQTSGPAVVSGTGSTGQPENGPYPAPTPDWTPRPSPAPTLPPPGILPTRTP